MTRLGRLTVGWRWPFVLAALWLATAAHAQSFPRFSGFVIDPANVLPPQQEAELTRRLDALQQKTGHQLVVATVPDLQGYTIEDYGYRLLRAWGVGLKGADNGAILIVAPAERKVRVEVGYGLEPWLTDAFSSVVINRTIVPRFKSGDMPGGIVAGANALADQLSLPEVDARGKVVAAAAEYDRAHWQAGGEADGGVPMALIFWLIVIAAVVLPMLARRRHRATPWGQRYGGSGLPIVLWSMANGFGNGRSAGWGGSAGSDSSGGGGWMGGGFMGGGGGSGGGGGASGSW